jgi:hypothetical protein
MTSIDLRYPSAKPLPPIGQRLKCQECGHVIIITDDERLAIIKTLTKPAHRHIISCPCGMTDFALSRRR